MPHLVTLPNPCVPEPDFVVSHLCTLVLSARRHRTHQQRRNERVTRFGEFPSAAKSRGHALSGYVRRSRWWGHVLCMRRTRVATSAKRASAAGQILEGPAASPSLAWPTVVCRLDEIEAASMASYPMRISCSLPAATGDEAQRLTPHCCRALKPDVQEVRMCCHSRSRQVLCKGLVHEIAGHRGSNSRFIF